VHKSEKVQPSESLLVRRAIPDWPERMTNGELVDVAKHYKSLAEQCELDRAAIAKDAGKGDAPADAKPAPDRPWWKIW
jgi:hypothetical protein